MNQHIALSIDFVRRICSDLRPGVLDKLGLIAAIEWQAREIESRTKLVVQVDAEVIEQQIDENISVTLFRIVQEALTNIVRHAQANMVEIKIVSTGEALELIIKDDGVGIDLGSLENFKSLGIIGMRERVSLIGGQLFISRDEKQGTIVTVRVLLNSNVEV
jgi:signal transduction histidine kinase